MSQQENIHGRKWGRGIRPWLLIPKYLFVALLVGGLFSVIILAVGSQFATSPDQSRFVWKLIAAIFHFQIIPGTVAAVVLGVLLLLQHPLAFIRMGWLWAKLLAVVIVVPASHSYLSYKVGALSRQDSSPGFLLPGVLLSLVAFVGIVILGRLKPRLGQGYSTENRQAEIENPH